MFGYMGRAVSFIQYMPLKPIKHGIKVLAICCSYSSVLLGFEVYCGGEENAASNTDKSALAVVQRLIEYTGIGGNLYGQLVHDNDVGTVAICFYWLVLLREI